MIRCEPSEELTDGRLVVSLAERNSGPVLEVLQRVLPATGLVVEIASGTGQHVVHFARALPGLTWQPTDIDATCRRSISAWLAETKLANIRQPVDLDVCTLPWPVPALDAVVCLNLIHIAPWPVAIGLFAGAGRALREGGVLYLYGPYVVPGRLTAPGNVVFDKALRAENPEWGIRDLGEVDTAAKERGFELVETIDMPANNLSVVFRKRHSTHA